jgi:hypothetical protein
MTSDIPYPFCETQAKGWLTPVRGEVRFRHRAGGQLIGGVGFYRRPSGTAELGFWLGRPGGVAAMPRRRPRRSCSTASRCIALPASRRRISSTIRHRARAGEARIRAGGTRLDRLRGARHDVEVLTFRLDRRARLPGDRRPWRRVRQPRRPLARRGSRVSARKR